MELKVSFCVGVLKDDITRSVFMSFDPQNTLRASKNLILTEFFQPLFIGTIVEKLTKFINTFDVSQIIIGERKAFLEMLLKDLVFIDQHPNSILTKNQYLSEKSKEFLTNSMKIPNLKPIINRFGENVTMGDLKIHHSINDLVFDFDFSKGFDKNSDDEGENTPKCSIHALENATHFCLKCERLICSHDVSESGFNAFFFLVK